MKKTKVVVALNFIIFVECSDVDFDVICVLDGLEDDLRANSFWSVLHDDGKILKVQKERLKESSI